MDLKNLYLSYRGRINRQPYWLGNLAFALVYFVVTLSLIWSSGLFSVDFKDQNAIQAAMSSVSWPLNIFNLISIWPAYALLAKRWHDRDKSGWWSLIIFVPIIGAVWVFVECGFLRGTDGPNRFGDDPLG